MKKNNKYIKEKITLFERPYFYLILFSLVIVLLLTFKANFYYLILAFLFLIATIIYSLPRKCKTCERFAKIYRFNFFEKGTCFFTYFSRCKKGHISEFYSSASPF
jgi:hypothetical protein